LRVAPDTQGPHFGQGYISPVPVFLPGKQALFNPSVKGFPADTGYLASLLDCHLILCQCYILGYSVCIMGYKVRTPQGEERPAPQGSKSSPIIGIESGQLQKAPHNFLIKSGEQLAVIIHFDRIIYNLRCGFKYF